MLRPSTAGALASQWKEEERDEVPQRQSSHYQKQGKGRKRLRSGYESEGSANENEQKLYGWKKCGPLPARVSGKGEEESPGGEGDAGDWHKPSSGMSSCMGQTMKR